MKPLFSKGCSRCLKQPLRATVHFLSHRLSHFLVPESNRSSLLFDCFCNSGWSPLVLRQIICLFDDCHQTFRFLLETSHSELATVHSRHCLVKERPQRGESERVDLSLHPRFLKNGPKESKAQEVKGGDWSTRSDGRSATGLLCFLHLTHWCNSSVYSWDPISIWSRWWLDPFLGV